MFTILILILTLIIMASITVSLFIKIGNNDKK